MSAAEPELHLTSGGLLARNTLWNMLGQILPMAVGVIAVPPLVRGMGVARFGLLSLVWILIGYFSLFDLGIGRALTKLVAEKIGGQQRHAIAPLVWTSLLLMFLLGLFGGLMIIAISPWLVQRALKIPEALQTETLRGFHLLALSIPMVTISSGLRGILEALQRFRILNLIRIPMSIFSLAGPLLALPFSHSLVPVIGVLVGGRLIGTVVHMFACLHAMPDLRHDFLLKWSLVVPVLRFGGWMTVSNLVSPMMVYLDRFVIGALLSVSAVAYYAAPFDVVTRLAVIPTAIAGVLFPAFAQSLTKDQDRTGLLLSRGIKYVFLAVFPIVFVLVALAPEGLRLWLGGAFAEKGSLVLRWLATGVLVNCLAVLPFALVQSAGRPDLTAKLHLTESPIYLLGLYLLVRKYGIEGAAIAWVGRVILDAVFLFYFAHRLLPQKSRFLPKLGIAVIAAVLVLYLTTFFESLWMKTGFIAVGLLVFTAVAWFVALAPEERAFMLRIRPGAPMKTRTSTVF